MNIEKTKYMIVKSIRKKGEVILRYPDGTQIERVEIYWKVYLDYLMYGVYKNFGLKKIIHLHLIDC